MKDEDGTLEAKDDVALNVRRINDCVEKAFKVLWQGQRDAYKTNWYSKRGKR